MRNNSAPGPDGISWEILKIKGTVLGRAIIEDVAQVVEITESWRNGGI